MITIIDYEAGNIGSIKNMLKKIGYYDVSISSEPEEILKAEKLILPGVGHYDFGMRKLHASGLIPSIEKKVLEEKVPILGICLGVQLFTEGSEEGTEPGLGWIKGNTIRFNFSNGENYKIPHMGWNEISAAKQSRLLTDMYEHPRFYFVHTYHLNIENPADVLVNCKYGYQFVAGVEKENIVGVQFHPEKSHKYGMRILENFVKHY